MKDIRANLDEMLFGGNAPEQEEEEAMGPSKVVPSEQMVPMKQRQRTRGPVREKPRTELGEDGER